MKINRTLCAAGICTLVSICLLRFPTNAQESQWELAGIRTSGPGLTNYHADEFREWKDLPLDTRERTALFRQDYYNPNPANGPNVDISLRVDFKDIPKVIPGDKSNLASITVDAMGKSPNLPSFVYFKCDDEIETISGEIQKDLLGGGISPAVYRVEPGEKTTFRCGTGTVKATPHEDFTVNMRVKFTIGGRGWPPEFTFYFSYHFFYKWMGSGTTPGRAASCFTADPAAGSSDRQAHSAWAEKQESATLAGNLGEKVATVFGCPSLTMENLWDFFADASVVVARYSRKSCFPDDEGVLAPDPRAHRNWASGQSKSELSRNLRNKVQTAFKCMNRSQQTSFFADMSVVMANAGK